MIVMTGKETIEINKCDFMEMVQLANHHITALTDALKTTKDAIIALDRIMEIGELSGLNPDEMAYGETIVADDAA